MSETNGAAGTDGKTYSQKEFEAERAHAQLAREDAETFKAKLKAYEGIDPAQVQKDREELEAARKKKALSTPEELEAYKAQLEVDVRSKVQKDLDTAKTEAETLRKTNKELTVTDRVFAQAATNIMPDMADFIKGQIRTNGDLNEKGEIVFKENGKEIYAPGSTTQLMNTEQYVQHLRTKFPSAFKAADKGGAKTAGEKTSAGAYTGKQLSRAEVEALPSAEQQKYFRENEAGLKAYLQGK